MIAVLTGGTGGAKFVEGLARVVAQEELVVIVNTGDDHRWWGLQVSPDVDSIVYVLGGWLSAERGWGVAGETFHCLQTMRKLGEPAWFSVGDRDLAVHLLRSRLMAEGQTLTQATVEIAARMGVRTLVLPMSDARVETRVMTPGGEISFEEYFVQRRFRDEVKAVRFDGADASVAAPGVLEAIRAAEVVLVAPSNPVTSIGPILAMPGVRKALRERRERVAAVSPIVGGAAVSGPAGALMAACGLEVSVAGVAAAYGDFLGALVIDVRDAEAGESLRRTGLRVECVNTLMRSQEDKTELARAAIRAAGGRKQA